MVTCLPTIMLTALLKCWQLGSIIVSQYNGWCHKMASQKMVRSSKILLSARIMLMSLDIK